MNTFRIAEWLTALSDDLLAVFETNQGCISLSPNWERVVGHAPERAMRNGFYRYLRPDQEKSFLAAIMLAIREAELPPEERSAPPEELPSFQLLCHGEPRWFNLAIGEVESRIGGKHRIVCCLRDAKIGKAVEMEQLRQSREIRLAERTRAELLKGIGHDLRTPLNAILGFTQIMESGIYGAIDNTHYLEYLRHMRESGYELLNQINALIGSANTESTTTVEPAPQAAEKAPAPSSETPAPFKRPYAIVAMPA